MRTPGFTPGWTRSALKGAAAGLAAVVALGCGLFPARLSVAMGAHGDTLGKVERLLGGVLLDLSVVAALTAPLVVGLALALPALLRPLRRAGWQALGPLLVSLPLGFALWVGTVVAQENKRERGSFPTLFDLQEGGSNLSFVSGALGFVRYQRVWLPALAGVALAAVVLWLARRLLRGEARPWRPWAAGVAAGTLLAAAGAVGLAEAQARLTNLLSPASLGDPLSGLVESAADLLAHRGPATPRQLVLDAELPAELVPEGAGRVGWPPARAAAAGQACWPHPHARPLDRRLEPPLKDPRGTALLDSLEKVSRLLFAAEGPPLAVFQVSLEGFRADDLHALHPGAPEQLAPFVNGLYRTAEAGPRGGVLAGHRVYQAGVRTAHGLGAMLCGLGTLPYNLAFIRDLQPFPVRCAPDVLAAAGFQDAFFYGSDPSFDGMKECLSGHGFSTVVGQDDLPADLPKGTWDAVTDLALFDQAVQRTAAALKASHAPQLAVVMSISNHGPFTPPQDLPDEVSRRVDAVLLGAGSHADADDRKRLIAYSYTDAAVARLFDDLEAQHLLDRSLVVLMADHSTGHAYLWEEGDGDSDEAKAQIPFVVVIPPALKARVADQAALDAALADVQRLVDEAPLSQNDVPAMLLALLSAHPGLASLPLAERWHTLGGQLTSPYFAPGGDPRTYLLGINGVAELYTLDRSGARVGGYEDSIFLRTRADRYHVTPRLIPVTALAADTIRRGGDCAPLPPGARGPASAPRAQAPH